MQRELEWGRVRRFWEYARLREMARKEGRRRMEKWDWVIAEGHFTNVRRKDDPGTRYIEARLFGRGWPEQVFAAVAYRMLNRQETFVAYGGVPARLEIAKWLDWVRERQAGGVSVKSGKHLTPPLWMYEEALLTARVETPAKDSEELWAWLMRLKGVGPFLAWQIYADLTSCPPVGWWDKDFVRVGDGAAYGLSAMFGTRTFEEYMNSSSAKTSTRVRLPEGRLRREGYFDAVLELRDMQDEWGWDGLTVIDIEHTLCEWTRWEVCHARGKIMTR